MTPGARLQATIELLEQIWSGSTPADQVVDSYFKRRRYAGSSDRRAVIDRLYQVIRSRARLDWWIDRTGGSVTSGSRARMIADLALTDKSSPEQTQALFSGSTHCPDTLSAEELELANQLYGRPLTNADMPRPVALEYPDWMDRSFASLWGDRLATEISALNQTAPLDLRVNTLKSTREQAQASLAAESVECQPTPLSPLGLRVEGKKRLGGTQAFRLGLVEVQDEGSQILSQICGAEPGMNVVDFCAGAGGKTLALAAEMSEGRRIQGRLTACDISAQRLGRMEPRLKRAGASGIKTQVLSAKNDEWVARNEARWDRVLCDAPCTGTGVWRRDPDAKWRFALTDLDEIIEAQRSVLLQAAKLVKPGGRLIYATCSLLQEENEQQMAWFFENNDQFTALPIDQIWSETVGGPPPPPGPCLRLSPASTGTDGFFATVLERQ
jgi:16S rRNA (cytosine967-C5)-methyltransferase